MTKRREPGDAMGSTHLRINARAINMPLDRRPFVLDADQFEAFADAPANPPSP